VNASNTLALLPLLLLASSCIVVMLAMAVKRSHALTAALTLIGLAGSFVSIFVAAQDAPRQVTSLLLIDSYALFYMGLIIASTAAVVVLSYSYLARRPVQREEIYLLLLLSTLGCVTLVASVHFVSFLLGLEILSVSLYAMVAYCKDAEQGVEAGIKYLILASASVAFLLMGAALIYADTGSMAFSGIARRAIGTASPILVLAGIALTVTGIGFKLGVVPFHLWTPDVYQGAPAPVTAFVATASKTAMVALLLRFLGPALHYRAVLVLFSLIAIASMCAGNFLAIRQNNVKRILAYSSIAHFGYILVAFQVGTTLAAESVAFYLVAYTVTLLVAFGIVAVLSTTEGDAGDLEDYRGLFWRRPLLAGIFTVALLSLAGIPATMGFLGKFYILAAGAASSAWLLMFFLVITSVAGLFYYLRIVMTLYASPTTDAIPTRRLSAASAVLLSGLAAVLIWFGVYSAPLLNLIHAVMSTMS